MRCTRYDRISRRPGERRSSCSTGWRRDDGSDSSVQRPRPRAKPDFSGTWTLDTAEERSARRSDGRGSAVESRTGSRRPTPGRQADRTRTLAIVHASAVRRTDDVPARLDEVAEARPDRWPRRTSPDVASVAQCRRDAIGLIEATGDFDACSRSTRAAAREGMAVGRSPTSVPIGADPHDGGDREKREDQRHRGGG